MLNTPLTISDQDFNLWQKYLESISGINLTKQKSYLLIGKISPLIKESGCSNFNDFLIKVKNDHSKKLEKEIIEAMTTNETLWFRDIKPFKILESLILNEFASNKHVNIWCAASSYGQEPYSIAMTILELKRTGKLSPTFTAKIIATDIDEKVLSLAKKGLYDSLSISRGLSSELKHRYFESKDKLWQLNNTVKNLVSFQKLNLKNPFTSIGKQDIIFIRNVCIYFSTEFKQDIFQRLTALLTPKGYLFLGAAESLSTYSQSFQLLSNFGGIYYQVKEVN